MKCIYTYKGMKFGSEIELDNFLFCTKGLTDSDLVFSSKETEDKDPHIKQKQTVKKLKELKIKNEKLRSDLQSNAWSKDIDTIDKYEVTSSDYIGITKFLSGLKNEDDKYLFPEFIAKNYWDKIYTRWKKGEFSPEEEDIIKQDNPDLFADGKRPKLIESQCDTYKKILQNKWEIQAKIGTSIHRVLQYYFSNYNKYSKLETQEVFDALGKYFKNDKKNGYIDDVKIMQVLDYAKELGKSLTEKYGECYFFPEYVIAGTANSISEKELSKNLLGIIDLLIVDKNGKTHIVDYKTSPHDFSKRSDSGDKESRNGYSSAKVLSFKYQLAVYKRLLAVMGIDTSATSLLVAPIQLMDFKMDSEGKWTYDTIQKYAGYTENISRDSKENMTILNRLQDIFYIGTPTNVSFDTIIKDLKDFSDTVFQNSEVVRASKSLEDAAKLVEEYTKGKAASNGKWYWKPSGHYNNTEIKADTKEDLIQRVSNYYNKFPELVKQSTDDIINIFNEAKDSNSTTADFDSTANTKTGDEQNPQYLNNILKKYLSTQWRILQSEDITSTDKIPLFEQLKDLGIILFKNNITGQIDVIRITPNSPDIAHEIVRGRKYITGSFESDVIAKNRSNLVLDSTYGNIDLMKTLFIINEIPEIFKDPDGNFTNILGKIQVINPILGRGLTADNKQIFENFNYLMKKAGKKFQEKNCFENNRESPIRIANNLDICVNRIGEIMAGYGNVTPDSWNSVNAIVSGLDKIGVNPEKLRSSLIDIKRELEKYFPNLKKNVQVGTVGQEVDYPQIEVYNYLLKAIAECDGIYFKQQLKDHHRWFEGSLKSIFANGLRGTYVDNPGTTDSDQLNDATTLVTRAYQNIREDVDRENAILRKLVNDYKNEVNFSYLKEKFGGNMASIYKNFYEIKDGDLMFANPDETTGLGAAGRKLLRYCIDLVNRNRYKREDETEEEFQTRMEAKKESSPYDYYKVPLMRGDMQSQLSTKGLLSTIKYRLSRLTFENIKNDYMDKVAKIVDPNEKAKEEKYNNMWQMFNIFEVGDGSNPTSRTNTIKYYSGLKQKDHSEEELTEAGLNNMERNIETLVLNHTFAYSQCKHINRIMPDLKAITTYIKMQEVVVNSPKGFKQDLGYLSDYIKNKVLHRSLIGENFRVAEIAGQKLMEISSKLALAFNPVQLYQNIESLWKNISLVIRKPDGTDAFTVKNMTESCLYTYKDLALFGREKSLTELLNELYSFNDMDMNVYADRVKSDSSGIWHLFGNLAFRMSSRPDYYNRMSIFGAQMRADGCWKAHSVKDNKLIYDWTKDDRFYAYANHLTTDPKYSEQKAAYFATAKQLVEEGALNADGTRFDIVYDDLHPTPLPKAYTSDQIEGYKSLSNTLYGYYTHENKSLMQSIGVGAMFFQMYTYISGKKNQYLQASRVSQQKYLKQYEEDGKKYYIKLDDKGCTTEDYVAEDQRVEGEKYIPLMVWKGRFTEGIMLTLAKAYKTVFMNDKGVSGGFKDFKEQMWNNPEESVRTAYRSNMQQLVIDIAVWAVVGKIIAGSMNNAVANYFKEHKVDGLGSGLAETFWKYNTTLLEHSSRDFNALDAIFGRTLDWNPFAISMMTKTLNNLSVGLFGDDTLLRESLQSMAFTRQLKPVWDYYIPKPKKDDNN